MAAIWEITLQSGILMLVLLFLRPLIKSKLSARVRYALWMIPAARLLLPFSVQSTVSVWNYVDLATPVIKTSAMVDANAVQAYAAASEVTSQGLAAVPYDQIVIAPNVSANISWEHILPQIGIFLWILGCVAVLMLLIINNMRFARRVKDAEQITAWAKLPILVSHHLSTPCLTGVIRPRILITPQVLQSDLLFDMAIHHEMTHYRRHDHIWAALRGMLLCIWWWNPLVWLAAQISREDCEAACDETVISKMPAENRKIYGMSLITLLRTKQPAQTPLHITTTMQGSKRAMKERITMIANWKDKGRKATICLAICIALLVPIICTSAAEQNAESSKMRGMKILASADKTEEETLDISPNASISQEQYFEKYIEMESGKGRFKDWNASDKTVLVDLMVNAGINLDSEKIREFHEGALSEEDKRNLAAELVTGYYGNGRDGILTAVDIIAKERGIYGAWPLTLKAWYSDMLLKYNHADKNGKSARNVLPSPDDISEAEALAIGRSYLTEVFGKTEAEVDAMRLEMYFQEVEGLGPNRDQVGREWMMNFYPDEDSTDLYYVYLDHDGKHIEHGEPGNKGPTGDNSLNEKFAELIIRDSFWTVEGLAAFAKELAPSIREAMERREAIESLPAYFAQMPYGLPTEEDISQEEAQNIAEEAVLAYTGWSKEMLDYYYKPSISYRLYDVNHPEAYRMNGIIDPEWRFGYRIPPNSESDGFARVQTGDIPYCVAVRIAARTGEVLETTEYSDMQMFGE